MIYYLFFPGLIMIHPDVWIISMIFGYTRYTPQR